MTWTKRTLVIFAMLAVTGCSESHSTPTTDAGTDGGLTQDADLLSDGGGDAGSLACEDRGAGTFLSVAWNWGGFCADNVDCTGEGLLKADGSVTVRDGTECSAGQLSGTALTDAITAVTDDTFIANLCSNDYTEVADYAMYVYVSTTAGVAESKNIVGAPGDAHNTWSSVQTAILADDSMHSVDCP